MSLKMLDYSVGEERKSSGGSSWTDGELEESVATSAPLHRLPTHGVRGLLVNTNWVSDHGLYSTCHVYGEVRQSVSGLYEF